MEQLAINKRIYGAIKAALVILLLSFGSSANTALAQGMVNVTVTGIPSVINTPFVDVFEQNFRNGRYQVIFTYNNTNTQPVNFRFQFRVTRNGKEIVSVSSDPKSYQPGAYVFTSIFDELTFPQTLDDILDDLGRDVQNQIMQAGSAPEGNYVLYIEAIPQNGPGMISSPPSINPFSVIYPEAPILINPSDNSNVTLQTPVFNWLNVAISGFSIEYDFLLVEVLQNQTALQAIGSNRAIAERTLMGQNTLVYTPEFLPLEAGQEYAWRVTAHSTDGTLPIKNDGESTIHTFVYQQGSLAAGLGELDDIDLVPGFARLLNLENLTTDERPTAYVLDGDATMELDFGQAYELPVSVKGLTIQKGSPENPNIMAGMVQVQGRSEEIPILNEASHIVDFDRIRWAYNRGVQAAGKLKLPDGTLTEADGWLQLSSLGLNGTLTADNPTGILKAGADPVELYIEKFEANFPAMQLFAQGRVELFGGESVCELTQLNVLEDEAQAVFNCPDDASVSLAEHSAQLELLLDNLTGIIDYDFETNDFGYDLNADGSIALGLEQAGQCEVRMQVNLKDATGFQISGITPICSVYAPPLDLGFVKLKLDKINLSSLSYESGNNWDFDLSLDGAMKFPAMDGWTLPISTVDVTKQGLKFPDIEWNARQLGINQPFTINGFGIKPVRFSMPHFTFPLFDWSQRDIDNDDTGDWSFNFDFDFDFPGGNDDESDSPGTILPACLTTRIIPGLTGNFDKGAFSANIPATVLKDCSIELADDYTFIIDKLGGRLTAAASASQMNLDSRVKLDARFMAGTPFNCGERRPAAVGKTSLTMNSEGLLDGKIDDIVNRCEAKLGPFTAGITRSALLFSNDGGQQKLVIGADGVLALNEAQHINGTLKYDVLKGEFEELDFTYNDAFILNLPSENESLLSFLVKGLRLTKKGLFINGRQEFIVGDAEEISRLIENQTDEEIRIPSTINTIGVTFDNTLISLTDFDIISGRIIFDNAFALEAGLDPGETDISFRVSSGRKKESLSPNSAYMELGERILMDKEGLHASGKARAGIQISDLKFESLEVRFSKDFAMGLQPFGVDQGQADFSESSRRIAYINSTGFHLDPTYLTQAIPDTLPLPSKETAYIVLRGQDDNLLVQATKKSDGTYRMSTTAPVDLVIPAIQGSSPTAPKVGVSFTNITYDPASGEITEGSIQGDFNPAIDLNEIGVPFKLRSIRYDDGIAINDEEFGGDRGLFLQGDILLYKQQIGNVGSASLFLENGDHLRGDIDLNNVDADIPLVSARSLAVLHVDSLKGSVNVALTELLPPDVSLDMWGQFRLQNQDENPLAALNYFATYNDGNFGINTKSQPQNTSATNTAFIGPAGFRIDKINSLALSYSSISNDFDFRSDLNFSLLMDISDGDTLEVPLQSVEITENGFLIPEQTINSSSTPVLNVPAFTMGPIDLELLEFRTLSKISFNWFNGEGVPSAFQMDFNLNLSGLKDDAPQASVASVTLENVGYNQGVITGDLQDYTPVGSALPVALGGSTYFNLTKISGGLINDGTTEDPVQGYDIKLAGSLEYPDFFSGAGESCINPTFSVNLSKAGGLIGVARNVAPCGDMTFGPATLSFAPSDSLIFAIKDNVQSVILGGSASAVIEQEDAPNITASGTIQADVLNGEFIDGEILVNDLFTYNYPQTDPFFTFRVQHARLNQSGVVFTGDASLAFPGGQDTARVTFINFAINPQSNGIASGEFTIQDSIGVEVGINPIDWQIVQPSSEFTRENAGRLLLAGGITVNPSGMMLDASSTAAIHAAGQTFPELEVSYQNFKIGFSPLSVTSGRADFTISGESSAFAFLDKVQFNVSLPGLLTSVLPDTLNLPNRETAFLVLGDNDGNRYEYDDSQSPGRLFTLPGETVSLVIPGLKNSGDTLKVDVVFDAQVDNMFNISSGDITLANPVDLSPYLDIPLQLDSLNYKSNRGLKASASVELPQSLNNIALTATASVGPGGFEQGRITAGEYTETYLPSQESITPIAADTLGGGALAFYIRGLDIKFGQTNSLAFSGQLKSDLLQDDEGHQTPIHYAASYGTGQWNVSIDNGNLTDGIDLGFAQIEPIPTGGQIFSVTMNQDEFAIEFAGIIRMEELLGDGFSLELQQMKLSTQANSNGDYVTVQAQQNLPPQDFALISDVLKFTSTETSILFDDGVLGIKTSGAFKFYNKTDLVFKDLEFRSDGTVSLDGINSGNLLTDRIELLPDSSLVLKDLSLGVESNALKMTANGFATLPNPLDQRADLTISGATDGTISFTGPEFIFDEGSTIGNNPDTEFAIDNFGTLELTALGLDVHLDDPGQTSLYATGVIYVGNEPDKRIMIGDGSVPGIKYSIDGGIEWNVKSNFDADSPLSFKYDFFEIAATTISINTDVTVDGETVPFQAEIGGETGLNIAGISGKADFSGFKFSTHGVDDIGHIDGSGSFSLMDVVSLELGSFEYKTAEDDNGGNPFSMDFNTGSGSADGATVSTEPVTGITKYMHFAPSPGGPGGQALRLSLSEGISGGVDEVIYYQKGEGSDAERYFKIKNASLELSDQASIMAGMEFLTKDGNFSLTVAGAGTFSSVGIVAAGNISTINDNLRFGIFVAASAPINFLGIIEVSSFGGGFYYRPTMGILDATKDVIKAMSGGSFKLNGDPPDVHNLKFAVLVYGEITLGGTSGVAAITANALIQVTDQFTKIDANGYVLGQKNSFTAGMYLTILYTPDVAGVEGGVMMDIEYDPVLSGSSRVDFFAKKDRTKPNSSVLWGIDGNFSISVINILDVDGTLLVSSDGLYLELQAGSGFDIAIISADASFELIVWYLPDYKDPLGIYGKFSISFSICHGLADFGASVEGGYFKRSSYSMIYFAGEAYVSVLGVIDGSVRGWVKFQTKSPVFDYGRGGSEEMEQLIADAKAKAKETKEKAEETKNNLNDAKDELNDALVAAAMKGFSDEELQKAGFKLVSGKYGAYGALSAILRAENRLNGYDNVPNVIQWIKSNVMNGSNLYDNLVSGEGRPARGRPEIKDEEVTSVSNLDDITQVFATQGAALHELEERAPQVESRIEDAIPKLEAISGEMRAALEEGGTFTLQNPVPSVQQAVASPGGALIAEPSFHVDNAVADSNKSKLQGVEEDIQRADQRYRAAIKAAAANIELIDLVVEGQASIEWGSEDNMVIDDGISVNDVAYSYTRAVKEVRAYNSELIGSFWDLGDWALTRANLLDDYEQDIINYGQINNYQLDNIYWKSNNRSKVINAAKVAKEREDLILSLGGLETPEVPIYQIIMNISTGANFSSDSIKAKFKQNAYQFWFKMPKLGLQELEQSSERIADSLSGVVSVNIEAIQTKHRAFTKSVNHLYAIKTNMLTTVYGMIEQYNGWRQEASSNGLITEEAPFSDKMEDIVEALAPPTIDYISGQPKAGKASRPLNDMGNSEYRDFYGTAYLSYQASHAQGVPEMSYALLDGTVSTTYLINEYYSAGAWKNLAAGVDAQRHLEMEFPKQNRTQVSRDLTGVVRARGTGGTTVSRLVNFTIPVAPGGNITGGSTIVNGDDTTPPTTPIVKHEYERYDNKYWTTDSTKLSFAFGSADYESDIRLFKYKIGTTRGGKDIRDWTDAQGTRGIGVLFIFPYTKLETTIRGLSLSADTDYYLSVKTVNGDNMESSIEKVSRPFRYDPTPPTKPEVSVTYANTQRQEAPTQPVIQRAVSEKPGWDAQTGEMVTYSGGGSMVAEQMTGQFVTEKYSATSNYISSECTGSRFNVSGANQGEGVKLSWSSEDPETDVEGFFWSKKNVGNLSSHDVFGDADCAFYEADEITEWNTTPSYEEPEYWYFQARNNVGMKGNMTVIGPINKEDATVSTTPNVKVRAAADGFYMYVTKLASDAQTGIKGYQYALLDSAGTDTIRAWPESTKIDFELAANAKNKSNPPVKFIPWGSFLEAGYYQVSVRAINGQNMASRAVTNTGVLLDNTPPEPTVFNVDYDAGTDNITLQISEMSDAESGLGPIHYQIISRMDPELFEAYAAVQREKREKAQKGKEESQESQDGFKGKAVSYVDFESRIDPQKGVVLKTESIQAFEPNMAISIPYQRLEYLVPVVVRIIVRNGVGLERANEKSIEISGELMRKVKIQRAKLILEMQQDQKKEERVKMKGNRIKRGRN